MTAIVILIFLYHNMNDPTCWFLSSLLFVPLLLPHLFVPLLPPVHRALLTGHQNTTQMGKKSISSSGEYQTIRTLLVLTVAPL